MFSRLGSIDIRCDAPPYDVVRACEKLGFCAPLDVCWRRVSHFLGEPEGFFGFLLYIARGQCQRQTCTCGKPIPILEKYAFSLLTNADEDYLLGQCARCWTMYWDVG
jgi:hypothetical protein